MSQHKKKNRNNQITINTNVGKVIERNLGYWIYLIIAQKSPFPAILKGVKTMKAENQKTLIEFENNQKEYSPVKNAIHDELKAITNQVSELDKELGKSLGRLTGIMMEHFHEELIRVNYGDLSAVEINLNNTIGRIEEAKYMLLKQGYSNKIDIDNPVWYLDLALGEFKSAKELARKEKE